MGLSKEVGKELWLAKKMVEIYPDWVVMELLFYFINLLTKGSLSLQYSFTRLT
jgi:hypothetical protein